MSTEQQNPTDEVNEANTASPATTAEEVEDEFDASQYVRDMIARMGAAETVITEPLIEAADPKIEPPPAAVVETVASNTVVAAPSIPLDAQPVEMRKRATPELAADLAQLREAANLTTTNALRTFDRKSLVLVSLSSLCTAVASSIVCLVLISLSTGRFSSAHLGSVVMFIFAIRFYRRYYQSTSVFWQHRNRVVPAPQG